MSDPQFDAFVKALADRYAIMGEIGRGSRAIVYRARQVSSGAPVAVKVFRTDLASALDFPRFVKQLQSATSLDHPGIIPILAVDEAAGRLFCVTPFVEGESLRARLQRERQLPLPDAVSIARQVADALGHSHARGVLHKDVKPENIFLSGAQALLMDLGLSRAISRAMEETRTGTGLSLGTPAYMSPEHVQGGVTIDERSDLYSLGCVLYEMLAGEPPFADAAPQTVWRRVLTDAPMPIDAKRDALPPGMGDTLDRLLAKAPSERFPDAAHLGDALATLHATL